MPPYGRRLPKAFFDRPVVEVARELIGCTLLRQGVGGRIVETEAYHPSEQASHGYAGKTRRNAVLFGAPGHAYVYFSYGVHALFNVVCEPEGTGAGVLVRALHPLYGVEQMSARRGRGEPSDLCSGPGKLAQALAIELSDNGAPVNGGPFELRAPGAREERFEIRSTTRIGITKSTELRWRFIAAGSVHLSGSRRLNAAGAAG